MKRWKILGALGVLALLIGAAGIGIGIARMVARETLPAGEAGPVPWAPGPGGRMGPWGGMGWRDPPWRVAPGTPLSDEEAVRIAREVIAAYGNPDLELAEVMAFDNHFYVQARERSTGRYAFEFLIDRFTGAAHPEPGPNMMWNARYGMMGNRWGASGEMRLSREEARRIAQAYLDQAMPGATVDEEADPFYGYYTLHILRDGRIVGMLSVHSSTGQVWVHTWHGNFLRMVYGHEEEHGSSGRGGAAIAFMSIISL